MHYGLCFLTVNFPITWSHYSNNGLGLDSNCFNQRAPRPALSVQHTGQRCAGGCRCCRCCWLPVVGGSSQLIYKGSSSSSQPSVKTNIFSICMSQSRRCRLQVSGDTKVYLHIPRSGHQLPELGSDAGPVLAAADLSTPGQSAHVTTLVNIGQLWSTLTKQWRILTQ